MQHSSPTHTGTHFFHRPSHSREFPYPTSGMLTSRPQIIPMHTTGMSPTMYHVSCIMYHVSCSSIHYTGFFPDGGNIEEFLSHYIMRYCITLPVVNLNGFTYVAILPMEMDAIPLLVYYHNPMMSHYSPKLQGRVCGGISGCPPSYKTSPVSKWYELFTAKGVVYL